MQQLISSQSLQANEQYGYVPRNVYSSQTAVRLNFLRRFMAWCNHQEEKRFFWLAIALLGNIGMVLPLTLLAILFLGGNNFTLWIIACAANVPILAVNLAAQHTKITLPMLFGSWLFNAAIVMYCVVYFFTVG